jgi:heterotetrameric sarcosine oxidase gamma subunit
MSGATGQLGLRFEFAEHPVGRVLEFSAFVFPPGGAFVVGWPSSPGEARHDAEGHPVLLHFAPARWLAPSPGVEIAALVESAERASAGTVADVTGKWREYRLSGPDAARALACSIDSAAVLDGRECAAVTLFDCPCVLARTTDGYVIWVRASFAADFAAAFGRVRVAG